MKTQVIRARVEEKHVQRIEQLTRSTGLSTSQILRLLIDNAEVRKTTSPLVARLPELSQAR